MTLFVQPGSAGEKICVCGGASFCGGGEGGKAFGEGGETAKDTKEEFKNLRSHFVASSWGGPDI